MSDDLISRKALLDRFRYGDKEFESDKAWICAVRRMIKEQPTAFDREKVIEELREELNLSAAEKERCARENPLQFDSAKGYANGIANAIEIVEKGGIE